MAFKGFGPQAIGFFTALAFHQNRDWFQENRALYESEVRGPMTALLDDLTERFAGMGIPLRGSSKSIFRINRDIRFSRDKRPYQTHCGAVLTRTGDKSDPGLLYIHIAPPGHSMAGAPEGSFVAAGFHMPETAVLNTLRTTIARDPAAWQKTEATLTRAGLTLDGEGRLTRVPRGFEAMKGSPVEAAIRQKSYIVEAALPAPEITTPALADTVVAFAERALPIPEFGWKALGRSPTG